MLYHRSIEILREQTGKNIVAWSANNKGNGSCNLHVAVLAENAKRPTTFEAAQKQGIVLVHAYTAHWRGNCEVSRIAKALNYR